MRRRNHGYPMASDIAMDIAPVSPAHAAAKQRPWKRVLGPGRRLEDKIVHFFVVMLMAIQLSSYCILRYAIEESAHRSLKEELEVGVRVLDRLLLNQGRQLQEAATVLSLDFGFREAMATHDQKTIASALENHA